MLMYKTVKHPIVAFDATGSVVKKLHRPNGLSGNIFLYQGVLTGSDNSHVPVVQMLSERHDVQAITRWLSEWIRAGAPIPKEAICDFSLALLGALVKAFTCHSDLKSYINECFGVLLQKKSYKLPLCFIRVDVAHFIKMICQWDCLRKKPHRVKDFYVRSMAQLVKPQSLEEAKVLIRSIAVVALSETEGSDSFGNPIMSEVFKSNLKKKIADETMSISDGEEEEGIRLDPCTETNTDLKRWVVNICEESRCHAEVNGD